MLLLDVTVVNVALPQVERSLHADLAGLQWVIDAYALTLAAFLLSAGSLGDRLGRRRLFTGGLAVFVAASLLCGLAQSTLALDLARALQGVGAASMYATSLALLAQEFAGARERGIAFGVWGATTGAAIALGPLVGGAIVEALDWRWIFLLNVPLGLGTIWLTLRRVGESRDPAAGAIDGGGLVTFSGALFLLTFALIRGNAEGWGGAAIVLPLAAAAVLLAAFVAIELRAAAPMLDLRLFRIPAFTGVAAVAYTQSLALYPMFLYLALYLEDVLGHSPLQTGLRFLPLTVVLFLVAPFAGRVAARLPLRAFLGTGLALVGAGLLLMHGLDATSRWTALLPGLVVGGFGVGLISPALATAAIGVVPAARSGMASGINNTFRQVGIATGIAGLGAVFQHRIGATVLERLPDSPARIPDLIASGRTQVALAAVAPGARPQLRATADVAFVAGLNDILLIAALVALAGAVAAFALIRTRDFAHGAVPSDPAAAPDPAPYAAIGSSKRRRTP